MVVFLWLAFKNHPNMGTLISTQLRIVMWHTLASWWRDNMSPYGDDVKQAVDWRTEGCHCLWTHCIGDSLDIIAMLVLPPGFCGDGEMG